MMRNIPEGHKAKIKITHEYDDGRYGDDYGLSKGKGRRIHVNIKHPYFEANRTFKFSEGKPPEVGHDDFYLKGDHQGKNIGKHFIHNSVDEYKKMGVHHVHLGTDDVGSYAWNKYGFIPNKDSWDRYRKTDGQNRLEQIKDPVAHKHIKGLLANPDPKTMWQISDLNTPHTHIEKNTKYRDDKGRLFKNPKVTEKSTPTTIGKHMLRNSGWDGSLNLTDKDSLKRFHNYTKPETHSVLKQKKDPTIIPRSSI